MKITVTGFYSSKDCHVNAELRKGKWRDYLFVPKAEMERAESACLYTDRDAVWLHHIEGYDAWQQDLEGNWFCPVVKPCTGKVLPFRGTVSPQAVI